MTLRVGLLLTGRCERDGMPTALTNAFGEHADVTFEAIGDDLHSFTSEDITAKVLAGQKANGATGPVEKLATALVSAVFERTWDLVIAIDDLELCNTGRAQEVRAFFKDAVTRELDRIHATPAERLRVAGEASFHLLAPMVEAYFFGEDAAVERAVSTAGVSPLPTWSMDGGSLEAFHTSDVVYLDEASEPEVDDGRARKTVAWRTSDRAGHPKRYIEFLCRTSPHGYREGKSGVAALRTLDFQAVLAAGAPLFAMLLEDIQEALGLKPRVYPSDGPILRGKVLRNA